MYPVIKHLGWGTSDCNTSVEQVYDSYVLEPLE